jgi:multidrug efflux pump subunit AcrB
MRSSYQGLIVGLGFAIVLVYLLIVVNFQSWLDPFSSSLLFLPPWRGSF